jgi:hypothetical protein
MRAVEEPLREAPQQVTPNVALNDRSRFRVSTDGIESILDNLRELIARLSRCVS